ncbi:MAG: glycosyl transferase family 1 [Flaviaesturariibacter sp.]|nr:glycosyl transferase family 1 [Flaviaesturariibacter sp.]
MRVLIIGPAHPLRGGLATFNQRLSQQFEAEGHHCEILSFSLQYPSILFPGKTQFSDEPAPVGLRIRSLINSVNPLNWLQVGTQLKGERWDLIVVRFWIPFIGASLGTILRQVRKNRHTKIVCIADNVIPHEKRVGDKQLTSYFLKSCHAFITMSDKVLSDLRLFQKMKPAQLVQHPLYDTFGERISKDEARAHLGISPQEKLVLFFGFIRKYKGLDLLLEAMADSRIGVANIKLLIAGEFYEAEKPYLEIITKHQLQDRVILHTHFIPDSEVKYYLCACDCLAQPYRNATQSGVTPLAYHFDRPMIVTNVGGLPDLVPDHKAGLVCEPQPASIADSILEFFQLGEDYFIPHLREEKKKYAWNKLTKEIYSLEKKLFNQA